MSRLPSATRDQFPDELKYVWDRLAEARDGRMLNVFAVMGNNPPLLRGVTRLAIALWAECGLEAPTRELVILRVAQRRRNSYEWHQHVELAMDAGVTPERIHALDRWQDTGAFSPVERAIFRYVDELLDGDHPSQEAHDALAAVLPPAAVVGVNLLVGFYTMSGMFTSAMAIPTERDFVGWQLENLHPET